MIDVEPSRTGLMVDLIRPFGYGDFIPESYILNAVAEVHNDFTRERMQGRIHVVRRILLKKDRKYIKHGYKDGVPGYYVLTPLQQSAEQVDKFDGAVRATGRSRDIGHHINLSSLSPLQRQIHGWKHSAVLRTFAKAVQEQRAMKAKKRGGK